MRQFQCVPTKATTYATEIRKTIFKFTLTASIMYIAFASHKHLKLPISIKILVTIPKIVHLRNEFNFQNVHGIMNTSGLLHS